MEFIATILGHYTDENRLLWQYFNETQPKWIFNLSQKKATHFRQLKENKWQGKTILSYIYTASFIYLRYIESDIETRHLASIYSVPNNVALYCFESKWALFFTTWNWCHHDVNVPGSSWPWSCVFEFRDRKINTHPSCSQRINRCCQSRNFWQIDGSPSIPLPRISIQS